MSSNYVVGDHPAIPLSPWAAPYTQPNTNVITYKFDALSPYESNGDKKLIVIDEHGVPFDFFDGFKLAITDTIEEAERQLGIEHVKWEPGYPENDTPENDPFVPCDCDEGACELENVHETLSYEDGLIEAAQRVVDAWYDDGVDSFDFGICIHELQKWLPSTDDIEVGDIVRLRSGGPDMTVSNVDSEGRVICEWFNNGTLEYFMFHSDMLEFVNG